jgi:ribosome-binding protein aMBF1 (putative translation factor)
MSDRQDCAARTPAHNWQCREAHVSVSIGPMEGEVRGTHLRRQRALAGFSIRDLADATRLSPTRLRQLEAAEHVTPRSVARFLDGLAAAWRARAEESAAEEVAAR